MDEHLGRVALKDGTKLDFYRTPTGARICHQDLCVEVVGASGGKTAELFTLLTTVAGGGTLEEEAPNGTAPTP